jgi:hypothetical protein
MVIIKCVILYVTRKLGIDVDGIVGLQNCMDILKSEPGSSSEKCLMSSDDGNQVVSIKTEEVTDMKVEGGPGPTTPAVIKTEPAVSCMSVWVQCCVHCTDIQSCLSDNVFVCLHKVM